MKKVRKSIFETVPPVRLYINEVRELYEVVCGNSEDVVMEVEGYQLSSADELKKVPVREVHNLEIKGFRPMVSVELRRNTAQVYVGSGDVNGKGIASELMDILARGRAKVYFVPSGFWGTIIGFTPLWGGIFMQKAMMISVGIAWLAGCVSLMVIDFRFRFNSYSTVLLIERAEVSSFWSRNKDQLLIKGVSGVVGFAVGTIVGPVFGGGIGAVWRKVIGLIVGWF